MFANIEATLYPIVCDINNYLSSYILIVLLKKLRNNANLRDQ